MQSPVARAKPSTLRVALAAILTLAAFAAGAQPAAAADVVVVKIGSNTTMRVTTTTTDWQDRKIVLSVHPTFSNHTNSAVTLKKFKVCYSAESRHVANLKPTIHNGAGTYSRTWAARGTESGACQTWTVNKRFTKSRDQGSSDHLFRIVPKITSRSADVYTIAGFRR